MILPPDPTPPFPAMGMGLVQYYASSPRVPTPPMGMPPLLHNENCADPDLAKQSTANNGW